MSATRKVLMLSVLILCAAVPVTMAVLAST